MSSWSRPIMFAPLRREHADDRNGTLLMRISLPIGDSSPNSSRTIVWPIRQTWRRCATSRSVNGSPSARFCQSRTSRNVGRRAVDVDRHPVLVAVDDLRAGADDRGDGRGPRGTRGRIASASSGVSVIDAARAEADAAAGGRAGLDQQVVGAHARRWSSAIGRGRALADLHHRDDRRDADDDAQRRQHRAHDVAAQGAGRPVSNGAVRHRMALRHLGATAAMSRPVRRRLGRRRRVGAVLDQAVADADRPLGVAGDVGVVRHQDDRDALLARSAAGTSPGSPRSSSSRGCPVGSSANSSGGWLISDRAMATRCCWPPDSCDGSWSIRSPRPTRSSSAVAALARLAVGQVPRGVGQRHHHVVERAGARQQVEALEDEADLLVADHRPARRRTAARPPRRRASTRPRSGGRGSRGCSSAWSCPSRTRPSARPARRARSSARRP